MRALATALAVAAVLTLCGTAQAHSGYLHKRQALRAVRAYTHVFDREHKPTFVGDCKRRAERVIDCRADWRGVDPAGYTDPSTNTQWWFRAILHDGKITVRWPIE